MAKKKSKGSKRAKKVKPRDVEEFELGGIDLDQPVFGGTIRIQVAPSLLEGMTPARARLHIHCRLVRALETEFDETGITCVVDLDHGDYNSVCLSYSPSAIRDHYDSADDCPIDLDQVTDKELRSVASDILQYDSTYSAFHHSLDSELEALGEQKGLPVTVHEGTSRD